MYLENILNMREYVDMLFGMCHNIILLIYCVTQVLEHLCIDFVYVLISFSIRYYHMVSFKAHHSSISIDIAISCDRHLIFSGYGVYLCKTFMLQ